MVTIDNVHYNKEFVKNYLKSKQGEWDVEDIESRIISNLNKLGNNLRMVNLNGYPYGDSMVYSFTFNTFSYIFNKYKFSYPNQVQLKNFLMSLYDEDIMKATITQISNELVQATLVITL